MFRFTIRDVLVVTLFVGVSLGVILVLPSYMDAPAWSGLLAATCLLPSMAIGMLIGKLRGLVIGAAIGFALGLLTLVLIFVYRVA